MGIKKWIRRFALDSGYVFGALVSLCLICLYSDCMLKYVYPIVFEVNINQIYFIFHLVFMLLSVFAMDLIGYSKGVLGKSRIKKYALLKHHRSVVPVLMFAMIMIGITLFFMGVPINKIGVVLFSDPSHICNSILFVLWMLLLANFEENLIHGIVAESVIITNRETTKGLYTSIVLTTVTGVFYSFGLFPMLGDYYTFIAWLCCIPMELILTLLYYEGKDIRIIKEYRFIYKAVMILLCDIDMFYGSVNLWEITHAKAIFNTIAVVVIAIGLIVVAYKLFDKKNIQRMHRYQLSSVMRKYALNGLKYKSKSIYIEDSVFKKHLDKNSFKSNGGIWQFGKVYSYILMFFAVCLLVVPLLISTFKIDIGIMPFVRTYGVELLTAQLSTTFLIVSFLSFLTSRDDYILWEDTMSYSLIHPPQINFISLSAYAFLSMAASAFFYCVKMDIFVLGFFALGILALTYLTAKMLEIFFGRKSLLRKLEKNYCESDLAGKKDMLERLFQNSCHVIDDNNGLAIKENFNFLSKMYNIYKRQMLSHENTYVAESEDYYASLMASFVPKEYEELEYKLYSDAECVYEPLITEDMLMDAENINYAEAVTLDSDFAELSSEVKAEDKSDTIGTKIYKYFFEEKDEIDVSKFTKEELFLLRQMEDGLNPNEEVSYFNFKELYRLVKEEIIYFVNTILPVNPTFFAKMLVGYDSKVLEIDSVAHEICNYIVHSVETDTNIGVVLIFIRDVFDNHLKIIEELQKELPFSKNFESDKVDSENIEFGASGFLARLYNDYRNIKNNCHKTVYENAYNGIMSEYEKSYIKMKKITKELEPIEICGNDYIVGVYKKWCEKLDASYERFKLELTMDRETQGIKEKSSLV